MSARSYKFSTWGSANFALQLYYFDRIFSCIILWGSAPSSHRADSSFILMHSSPTGLYQHARTKTFSSAKLPNHWGAAAVTQHHGTPQIGGNLRSAHPTLGSNQSPLNSEQVAQGWDQLGAGSLQEQAIHSLLGTLSQNVIIHCRLY